MCCQENQRLSSYRPLINSIILFRGFRPGWQTAQQSTRIDLRFVACSGGFKRVPFVQEHSEEFCPARAQCFSDLHDVRLRWARRSHTHSPIFLAELLVVMVRVAITVYSRHTVLIRIVPVIPPDAVLRIEDLAKDNAHQLAKSSAVGWLTCVQNVYSPTYRSLADQLRRLPVHLLGSSLDNLTLFGVEPRAVADRLGPAIHRHVLLACSHSPSIDRSTQHVNEAI